jgi:hypothetical protein
VRTLPRGVEWGVHATLFGISFVINAAAVQLEPWAVRFPTVAA